MTADQLTPRDPPERAAHGDLLVQISNRIVGIHKELYGKGPTKARTYYQDDLVVVLLRGGFTKVEETLYLAGRTAAVLSQRAEFQAAVEGRFTKAIEELTGRRVVGFMSTTAQEPDLSAELFVLESTADDKAKRGTARPPSG